MILGSLHFQHRLGMLPQGEGTNYSFTAHTALHWAAAKGHAALTRWLLAAGASASLPVNAGGGTPLHAAADNQQMGCAEVLLILGGADIQVRTQIEGSE